MYKMLDSLDEDRSRVRKPPYREFLALERNLYESTIMDSLKVIYDRSYSIIGQLSAQKRKVSEVSSIILRFDLSKFDALYGSFSTSAKVVITTIVANVLIGFMVRASVTATVAGGAAYLGVFP
jgi:hypothetical protein